MFGVFVLVIHHPSQKWLKITGQPQEERAGGAGGSEHPEIAESVFHTAPLLCCSF